ncbi:MAG: metallophosphoesterase, partial [Planctomycetota bacterium]|nr:metallophosphoesterase [Planctomycetota bacterium]
LLVAGDIHDNPRNYAKIIEHAKLGNDDGAHLVLQELIHGERLVGGVDLSYRMLLKASNLLLAHPGRVHLLLANHELAQMAGHSVSKGSGCMTTRFDEGLARVFDLEAPRVEAAVAEFVRAMPLAARTDRGVLCAHSLPGPEMIQGFDVGILERGLEEADYEPFRGSAWKMVWGRSQDEAWVEELAERWEVSLFCLGHALVEDGITLGGPRTVLLNSDHERGRVLPIDLSAAAPTAESALFAARPIASLEEAG